MNIVQYLCGLTVLLASITAVDEPATTLVSDAARRPVDGCYVLTVPEGGTFHPVHLADMAGFRSDLAANGHADPPEEPVELDKDLFVTWTDSAGVVPLSLADERTTYLFVHDAGFAARRPNELKKQGAAHVELAPWSAVEGTVETTLLNGTEPQLVAVQCKVLGVTYKNTVMTDERGRFRMERVPRGDATVEWYLRQFDPVDRVANEYQPPAAIRSLTVDADVVRDVVLRCEGHTAVGKVMNMPAAQDFAVRCYFSQLPSSLRKDRTKRTPIAIDDTGEIRAESLVPGTYTICVEVRRRTEDGSMGDVVQRAARTLEVPEDAPKDKPIRIRDVVLRDR